MVAAAARKNADSTYWLKFSMHGLQVLQEKRQDAGLLRIKTSTTNTSTKHPSKHPSGKGVQKADDRASF